MILKEKLFKTVFIASALILISFSGINAEEEDATVSAELERISNDLKTLEKAFYKTSEMKTKSVSTGGLNEDILTRHLLKLSEIEAGELLNSGKQGRGPKVVKELGDNIEIRDGRYGMYITDGKVNAKMPKDISQDELTLEEAKNLIEQKKSSPKRKFRKK